MRGVSRKYSKRLRELIVNLPTEAVVNVSSTKKRIPNNISAKIATKSETFTLLSKLLSL